MLPGAIVGLTVLDILKSSGVDSPIDVLEEPIRTLLVAAMAYALGIAVQTVAELLGVNSAHPRPLHLLAVVWKDHFPSPHEARAKFRARMAVFLTHCDSMKQQRERYVYLKECSANSATALLIVSILIACASPYGAVAALLLAALLMYATICARSRQAHFEIATVKEVAEAHPQKLLDSSKLTDEEIRRLIGREL